MCVPHSPGKEIQLWRAELCHGDTDTCLALLSCWDEGDWAVLESDCMLESGSPLEASKKGSKTDAECYCRNFMDRGNSLFQEI